VLTQNDCARNALLDTFLDLTRAQLDQREERDEFWVSVVELVFSAPSIDVFFAPLPDLNDVCATDTPRLL
jgi:hypothetical protein